MDELDLSKICIDFGESKQAFYDEYLRNHTRREIFKALCHISAYGKGQGHSIDELRNGKYVAWRFKNMCKNLGINPKIIFEKYRPTIRKRVYRGLQEVDPSVANDIQNLICDMNDNKS